MIECYNTCLLIDDNYIDNIVTRKLLEYNRFAKNIVISESPDDALEWLRDGLVMPDVIFLDIRMPTMDGFEFLELYDKLTIDKQSIKVYLLSSSLDPLDIKKSSDNKYITQFLHKPVTQKILEEISL
jgi:CheY-like chemotaxis protein